MADIVGRHFQKKVLSGHFLTLILIFFFSANPIGAPAGAGSGETRVAVRRRPVYSDRVGIPEDAELGVVQGVRLVARRPNALVDGNVDRGNVLSIRRRPTPSKVR